MPHDVFISYCSEDRKIADAVCATLEASKIRCWIAPRDVLPGANWGSAIIDAIKEARIVVIILSSRSNKSPQVMREIERAVHAGDTIIPFRVEDVLPSKDLEYFISSCHWLDAITPPMERHLAELSDRIHALVGHPVEKEQKARPTPAKNRRWTAWHWAGTAAIVLLAAAVSLWKFMAPVPAPSGTVQLAGPAPGATVLGSLLFSWSGKNLNQSDLEFELWVSDTKKTPVIKQITRNSYRLDDLVGPLKWKVRPVWRNPTGRPNRGEWSEEREVTFYPSALDRILATRTIYVGTGESDGIYVRNENGRLTGFDIELLRKIGTGLLQTHQLGGEVQIVNTYRVWGTEYFRLLEQNPAVDLLASGISITLQREKDYGFVFTRPILRYPQTLVTAWGTKPFTDGKLVLGQLAFVEKTTSEELAERLLGSSVNRLKGYKGSGAYDEMFSDLVQRRIEGILLDKPYALQKIEEFNRTLKSVGFATADILGENFADVEPEKIGWALRPADRPLLDEINSQLEQQKRSNAELIKKFFPNPEAFLPD